jgi:hypothetical protein
MLSASQVGTWLTGLGFSIPVLPGPLANGREPPAPDVIAIVMPAGGAPPTVDGLFDSPAFQVAIRGPQRRTYTEAAFSAAWEADRLIRLAPLPGWIGSSWCSSVVRSSGAPTLLGPSPDPAERMTYTASYLFTVSVL